jgi:tetraacyldisaccharide 4'-kinase
MDVQRYFATISGRDRSLSASCLRGLLSGLTPFYRLGIGLRNFAFDHGWRNIARVQPPVISVGNLTTGGSGKTPVVAWIVNWLVSQGRRPVILSRGYRALDEAGNDEKRLMDQLCPGVPHLQNPSRTAAAQQALQQGPCDVFVLDDAFQHRQFHRDLDIVLIDATNPWGFGHLLPRGLLREPITSLHRCGLVIITRTDQVPQSELSLIESRVLQYSSAPIVRTKFVPQSLVDAIGTSVSLDSFMHGSFASFCGIGNPEAFWKTLTDASGQARFPTRSFPDHHHYSHSDVSALESWARIHRVERLITTRKDLVKIPRDWLASIPILALEIELRLENPSVVEVLLEQCLSARKGPGA